MDGTLEELEIVAGHVWSAVGGVDDGNVTVAQVDPKRFGVETAAATTVQWVAGEDNQTRQLVLSTTRPYKPMDLIMVEKLDDGAGTIATVQGYTSIEQCQITGTNQFNSSNPIPSLVFGSVLSAPRPKIRFDTVQTSPALTMDVRHVGSTIGASETLTVEAVFSGVAVKR
jgi:hypothetical protein